MDLKEVQRIIDIEARRSLVTLRQIIPWATGDMFKSVTVVPVEGGGFEIYVDVDYFKYTNNSGPNAGWVDEYFDILAARIGAALGSSIIK